MLLAQVCASLEIPGNDPTRITAARDKWVMQQSLSAAGVHMPVTRPVPDLTRLRTAADEIRTPWVLKPADGAGSAGVTVVHEPADLKPAWHRTRAAGSPYRAGAGAGMLLQKHVAGIEYSVESIAYGGAVTHLCLTAKTVTGHRHRVEIGHRLPADLPRQVTSNVLAQVDQAMNAAGIRNGAAHTEVIVDPGTGGHTILEIAARRGAGHIGTLIGHALGIDVPAGLLDIARGRHPQLTPARNTYAAVRFLTSSISGRLRAVSGLPQIGPEIPEAGVRTAPDTTVRPPRANHDRLGYFIVTGDHPADVDTRAQALVDQIHVDVTSHHTPAVISP